jgi:hypothetical protein
MADVIAPSVMIIMLSRMMAVIMVATMIEALRTKMTARVINPAVMIRTLEKTVHQKGSKTIASMIQMYKEISIRRWLLQVN